MEHKLQCSIKSMLKLHVVQTCFIYLPYEGDYTKIDQITASNICLLYQPLNIVLLNAFLILAFYSISTSLTIFSSQFNCFMHLCFV